MIGTEISANGRNTLVTNAERQSLRDWRRSGEAAVDADACRKAYPRLVRVQEKHVRGCTLRIDYVYIGLAF